MKINQLESHKQSHLRPKKYHCSFPDCTTSCTTPQHLRIHENEIHQRPNPYQVPPISHNGNILVHRFPSLFRIIQEKASFESTYYRGSYTFASLSMSTCR